MFKWIQLHKSRELAIFGRDVCLAHKFISCCCVALLLFLSSSSANAQSNLVDRPRRELLPAVSLDMLEPSTKQLAEQLEIWDELQELHNKSTPMSFERRTALVRQVHETILESYFDAMTVQAEADRELGNLEAIKDRMIARRDRAVETNNGTNFIASGTLNTVGSILGFSAKTPPFPGNLNQMLSGVVSMGMSTYALKQQSGGKVAGEGRPTVLAELFGRPTDAHTSYPESVWRFLHSPSPENLSKTRLQVLEEKWILRDHLEDHGSKRERQKIDLVSGIGIKQRVMSIDDLTDQMEMISDIASTASLMVHHLRDLLRLIDSDVLDQVSKSSL